MHILAIPGSLRKDSSNKALLKAAAHFAPEHVTLSLFDGLGHLPLFNPDLEGFEPQSVLDFRAALRAADAILISSPEYAHGITGALKNGLDWIVGSGELVFKPVALLNASARSSFAYDSLKEIVKTMDAHLIIEACQLIPLPHNRINDAEIIAHPELSRLLQSAIHTFIKIVEKKKTTV